VSACLISTARRQIRTFTAPAPLHKDTVGLLALGHNQDRQSADYANVSVKNRARTRLIDLRAARPKFISSATAQSKGFCAESEAGITREVHARSPRAGFAGWGCTV
jgi:hypothetical protein